MEIDLLIFQDETLTAIPSPSLSMVKPFSKLLKRDRSRSKATARRELCWIYCLVDPRSPFKNYEYGLREERLQRELFDPEWKPDALLLECKEEYEKMIKTPSVKLLEGAENAALKIAQYLQDATFKVEHDEDGKIIGAPSDPGDIMKILAGLDKTVTNLKTLKERAREELDADGATRGQVEVDQFSQ